MAVAVDRIGLLPGTSHDTIDRETVEKAGLRQLPYEVVGASEVSCPGGLEERTGAKVVGTIVNPESPVPPKRGRVEIRVSGFDTRRVGGRTWKQPELAVRVIERAREPRR